jgi:predicted ATPase
MLGYPEQALQKSYEALSLAQELAHPFSLAFAPTFVAVLHELRREMRAAQEHAGTLIMLAREQGFPFWRATGTGLEGRAMAAQGRGVEGIARIHQGMAAFQATGARLSRPWQRVLLAGAYMNEGQAEQGLHLLTEALVTVHETGERFFEAELHRLKGELLLAHSVANLLEAESCFQQALAVARRQEATALELRAAMNLSRLWQQQGQRDEAHALLAPIYGRFSEGFDTADLREAKALLAELS